MRKKEVDSAKKKIREGTKRIHGERERERERE